MTRLHVRGHGRVHRARSPVSETGSAIGFYRVQRSVGLAVGSAGWRDSDLEYYRRSDLSWHSQARMPLRSSPVSELDAVFSCVRPRRSRPTSLPTTKQVERMEEESGVGSTSLSLARQPFIPEPERLRNDCQSSTSHTPRSAPARQGHEIRPPAADKHYYAEGLSDPIRCRTRRRSQSLLSCMCTLPPRSPTAPVPQPWANASAFAPVSVVPGRARFAGDQAARATGQNGSHGSGRGVRTIPAGRASQDELRSNRGAHLVDRPARPRTAPRAGLPESRDQDRQLPRRQRSPDPAMPGRRGCRGCRRFRGRPRARTGPAYGPTSTKGRPLLPGRAAACEQAGPTASPTSNIHSFQTSRCRHLRRAPGNNSKTRSNNQPSKGTL